MTPPATNHQINYLEILFIDCDSAQRNAYLSHKAGRPISALDELTVTEASHIIIELSEQEEREQEDEETSEEDAELAAPHHQLTEAEKQMT